MSLLNRYIFKEWTIGFALTMGVILGVLLLQSMLDSLPELLAANASISEIGFFTEGLPLVEFKNLKNEKFLKSKSYSHF